MRTFWQKRIHSKAGAESHKGTFKVNPRPDLSPPFQTAESQSGFPQVFGATMTELMAPCLSVHLTFQVASARGRAA